MILNPVTFLSSLIVRTLVRRLGLPGNIFALFSVLITTSLSLSRITGILPLIPVLWRLRTYIPRNFDLATIRLTLQRSNPYVVNTIISAIQPYWNDCLKVKAFYRLYSIFFIPLFLFSSFKPITFWLIRVLFGVIVSAIGILWNESLSSIGYLKKKDLAYIVVELIEDNTNF